MPVLEDPQHENFALAVAVGNLTGDDAGADLLRDLGAELLHAARNISIYYQQPMRVLAGAIGTVAGTSVGVRGTLPFCDNQCDVDGLSRLAERSGNGGDLAIGFPHQHREGVPPCDL